ncbi:MAG TPA: hypothetical protein VGA37_14810, partial [Gemmatimonadales bacterium]
MIVVTVAAGSTRCASPADVLPRKFPSPAYVATSVFAPAVVDVSEQLPSATVPTQPSVPSVTVTLPVGVPAPGATAVTANVTVYASPTTDGSGSSLVIVVTVAAGSTWCGSSADVLPRKFPSPAYVATSVFAPAVVDVSEQLPAATVSTQLAVPSLTVTLPVGVPAPGATAATVNVTVYACPTTDGSGSSPVIVVTVSAGSTWWSSVSELGLKFPSPAYVAVSVFAPAVVDVTSQPPTP